jgi:integrase
MTQKIVANNDEVIYLEKKIKMICNGSHSLLLNSIFKKMSTNLQNAKTLYLFLVTEYENENTKLNTTLSHIKIISQFNVFSNCKDFDKIIKNDISGFLNSARKNELEDPTHKWIGTYNTRHMVLSKFFRWYYNYFQNNEADQKKWVTPICMQGIKQLARKEKSAYKPSDMWIEEDHALFLKYCPEKRDRCFHAMANDTSARPNELLNLRIKDIKFKISSTNLQYAEVNITKSKTKPRTLPLIHSIPYVKDWLDSHPFTNNPESYLFVSLSDNNFGNRLSGQAIYKSYTKRYQKNYFPNLIKNNIPERDKSFIRNLLTKPWTPYILRHSALTSKSLVLNEHTLRDHAGWTMSSKMPEVYLHYLGNESSKSLLEAYGIEDKNNSNKKSILKSKPCPNCDEPNKPESKFCFRCKMVLTFDSYQEALEKQKEKDKEINEMKDQIQTIMNTLGGLVTNQNDKGKLAKGLIDSGYYIHE